MPFNPYRRKGLPQIEGGDKTHLDGELKKIGNSLVTSEENFEALGAALELPTNTLLGRDTAGDGVAENITVGGGIEFTGAGAVRTTAFTGDVTKTAGGTALTIANDAVTYAKIQDVSATDRLLGRDTAGAGNVEELTVSGGLEFTGTGIQLSAGHKTRSLTFVIDGGGSAITTGLKGYLEIPFACTITQWTILVDPSGSIVIDVWKDTYASAPPVVGDVITASAKPTVSAASKGQSSTLTGWTTSIAAGDILAFNVNSITTCTKATISLKVTTT